VSRLRRVLFQWGPLPHARLSLSCIGGRVSGKRTHPRRLKSLEAQRLEILLTTPSLQTAHHSGFIYNAYGTRVVLRLDISGWQCAARYFPARGHRFPGMAKKQRDPMLHDCLSSSSSVVPNEDKRDDGNCHNACYQGNWIRENIFQVGGRFRTGTIRARLPIERYRLRITVPEPLSAVGVWGACLVSEILRQQTGPLPRRSRSPGSNDRENKRLIPILDPRRNLGFRPGFGLSKTFYELKSSLLLDECALNSGCD
jgi:hypothetical protein